MAAPRKFLKGHKSRTPKSFRACVRGRENLLPEGTWTQKPGMTTHPTWLDHTKIPPGRKNLLNVTEEGWNRLTADENNLKTEGVL